MDDGDNIALSCAVIVGAICSEVVVSWVGRWLKSSCLLVREFVYLKSFGAQTRAHWHPILGYTVIFLFDHPFHSLNILALRPPSFITWRRQYTDKGGIRTHALSDRGLNTAP